MSSVTQKLMMSAAGVGGVLPLADFFSADSYTGTSASHTITNGIDMSGGSMLWVKRRSGDDSLFFDSARGASNRLLCPASVAQTDIGEPTFSSTGFTLGSGNAANYPNNNGNPYTSYSFKESPQLFDIVTYTGNGVAGREIPHDLGAAPAFIMVKSSSQASGWMAWHKDGAPSPAYQYSLFPGGSGGWDSFGVSFWGSASSYTFNDAVFTVGSWGDINASGRTYVAYLFADSPAGPLKVGSYSGNSSTQVIDLGFTSGVKFLMLKCLSRGSDWYVWDANNGIGAGAEPYIRLNSATAQVTDQDRIYYDSRGFGLNADYFVNWSGDTFMYMAIGE